MSEKHTFRAIIEPVQGGGAFVRIPFDVEKTFGRKRVPICALIDGRPYRGTLVRMGTPCHILGILKEIRLKIGKQVGDEVEVTLEEDTAPRRVELPEDFRAALEEHPSALAAFQALSYTHQREHVRAILEAKKAGTRQNRILAALELLGAKK